MSRAIVYEKEGARGVSRDASAGMAPDDYSGRLLKLIPVEVITLYVTLITVAKPDDQLPGLVLWVILLFGLGATYLYSRVTLKVTDNKQLAVTVGAFFVWALTIGGPFEELSWYSDTYGALILPVYTFLVPYMMRA